MLPSAGEACDSALKKLTDRDVHPICRIPLITSSREEQQLISQSTKPVVKLLINRHNNKYSYTRCVFGGIVAARAFCRTA